MAVISDIKIGMELRPCYYYEQKALFHKWLVREHPHPAILKGTMDCIDRHMLAVIELEDGSVIYAPAQDIQFADSEYKFEQYVWEGDKE